MTTVCGPQIKAVRLDRHSFHPVTELLEFRGQGLCNGGLLPGCRFNVNQLASQGENVHLQKDSLWQRLTAPRWQGLVP